ncbi:hypothetical protein [Micromonospora cathayae]|uniref:Uncharacterized protein n=1 Tax=Micromonospora cathayae TaxID=3028804 RepID=A0ABY7ZJK9_9ACTN|nr:hypothetical protein [Micromonospora sp. HUAS 3]WDZ83100.1 hypothetical protein PVK37_21865 [Micromonospora sp. HUAS 3]
MSRIRARALALVLVVLLTGCSEDATEPAAAPSPGSSGGGGEDDRWACRELQASLLDTSGAQPDENAAIGGAAARSTHADTRAAGAALVAAAKQAEGTKPGSAEATTAELAIAKARGELLEACLSQFGDAPG